MTFTAAKQKLKHKHTYDVSPSQAKPANGRSDNSSYHSNLLIRVLIFSENSLLGNGDMADGQPANANEGVAGRRNSPF